MSLWVAVPCAVAAAVLFGVSTAMQHQSAHNHGQIDARQLVRLLVDPRWMRSLLAGAAALALESVALATGPVVLIQPVLVLALPVSLPFNRLLGGPRPGRADYLACVTILLALAGFFAVVGSPGDADPVSLRAIVLLEVVALVAAVVICAAVTGGGTALRAGVVGGVSGALLGIGGVLISIVSAHGLESGARLAALIGVLVVGGTGGTLLQVSFQIGSLGASYPASLAASPLVAVLLGGTFLHENVRSSTPALLAYLAALVAIVVGAVRLANSPSTAR